MLVPVLPLDGVGPNQPVDFVLDLPLNIAVDGEDPERPPVGNKDI